MDAVRGKLRLLLQHATAQRGQLLRVVDGEVVKMHFVVGVLEGFSEIFSTFEAYKKMVLNW